MRLTEKRYILTTLLSVTLSVSAQTGLFGFANYSDLGLQGTTGGMGGEIVHVNTREDFARYAHNI